jgi:hypothetical protein
MCFFYFEYFENNFLIQEKVITTKAAAANETYVEGDVAVVGKTTTQIESSNSAGRSSSNFNVYK